MVGIRSFPFGWPMFRGKLLVFREGNLDSLMVSQLCWPQKLAQVGNLTSNVSTLHSLKTNMAGWKIHHEWRSISYWKWGDCPDSYVSFHGGLVNNKQALKPPPRKFHFFPPRGMLVFGSVIFDKITLLWCLGFKDPRMDFGRVVLPMRDVSQKWTNRNQAGEIYM